MRDWGWSTWKSGPRVYPPAYMNVTLSFSPKPQPERSMRLLNFALPFTLFLCITSCPPDDVQIAKISKPLGEKFNGGLFVLFPFCDEKVTIIAEDICGQGIKPGGATDVKFVSTVLLPYYLNKKWLTKDPPKGLKCLDCTTGILFSFYLSRLGKGERQDSRQVPQEYVQLL